MPALTTNSPISGGIVPSGLSGNQLAAITRRAVIPSIFVQLYQSHPLFSLLLSNAQRARGGLSQITFPVQSTNFNQFSWSNYVGNFNMPSENAALQNAQFNLKLGLVPIGFFGMEAIVQSSEVIIPKLRAVTSDAAVVIKQALATSIYANNYANTDRIDSLAQAYDDGTNAPTYGGITRTGNSWWNGQLYTSAGAISNRQGMAVALTKVMTASGGESPDYAVMNPADWATLMSDFMNYELYQTGPRLKYGRDDSVNAGFRAVRVLDTPIFPDPFCPRGEMYAINSRYLAMYLSEYAPFVFSGFESTIPLGQIASVGVLIVALNMVCSKPLSGAHFTGITGASFTVSGPSTGV
jgi:hypothetical protein